MRAAVLAAVAMALCAASAQAHNAPAGLSPAAVERGFVVGQQYWGTACGGEQITVAWEDGDSSWAAFSHWHWDGSPDQLPFTDCQITFNTYYRDAAFMHSDAWVCTSVVHELGHLTGHQHSPDPNSVMHAPARIVGECLPPVVARRGKLRWHWSVSTLRLRWHWQSPTSTLHS